MAQPKLKVLQGGLTGFSPRKFNLGAGPNFDKELKRLRRRINLINSLKSGDASVRKIYIEKVWVSRHQRRAHTRHVIVLKKDAK